MTMADLVYEPIRRMSKREIVAVIRENESEKVLMAVLSAALYSGDGKWAEKLAYKLIDHSDALVRGNAMLSLSHIARIHGTIDRSRAIDILRVARNDRDEFVRGHAENALEDVQHFIKRSGRWIGRD